MSKSKLEEFLNALGLRIDDAPKTQPEAENAAPEQVTDQTKPMDAEKIAAEAVAKKDNVQQTWTPCRTAARL